MDLFVDRGFIEKFESEFDRQRPLRSESIVFTIFSRYPGVILYTDAPESIIETSELISRFADMNPKIVFDYEFSMNPGPFQFSPQTIVLTETDQEWFVKLREKGVLCFSYESFRVEIERFIDDIEFYIDLSDRSNIPIDFNHFKYLSYSSGLIIISDPYILSDSANQKIKNNIVPLLKNNLVREKSYDVFIITKFDGVVAEGIVKNRLSIIAEALSGYNISIRVINTSCYHNHGFNMHDRLIYTANVLAESGIGFNLSIKKPVNSVLSSKTILNVDTYKRMRSHFKMLTGEIEKIKRIETSSYKTNDENTFDNLLGYFNRMCC